MQRPKLFIALLRIALGWLFLYQGVTALMHSDWSILPYIKDAQTFHWFYVMVSSQPFLLYVTYIIKGIFVISGGLLILGIWTRVASFLGILLMLFFYFPLLNFPHVGTSYYLVDDHLIYLMILLYLFTVRSNEFFGLGSLFRFSRY